jgi:hypothetical protein
LIESSNKTFFALISFWLKERGELMNDNKNLNANTGKVKPNPTMPDPVVPNVKNNDKESFTHKTGDKVERMGQKVKNAGAEKLGNAIYNAGDKLEHSRDKKH